MNRFRLLLTVLVVIIFHVACEQKVSQLGKEDFSIEVPIENQESGTEQGKKIKSLLIPPIRYVDNSIYVCSNGVEKNIKQISTTGEWKVIIGKFSKSNIKLNQEDPTDPTKPHKVIDIIGKPRINPFQFDYIKDFFPSHSGDVYVLNLVLPEENKKPDETDKNPADQAQQSPNKKPFTSYIFKFNKNGEYLYKIGIKGKESAPFPENKTIIRMFCDQDDFLYLVLKDDPKESSSLGKSQYELIRYNPTGDIDVNEKNLSQYIPEKDKYIFDIEDILISPSNQELIISANFYSTEKNKKERGFMPEYKALYGISFKKKPYNTREIHILKENEQYYSILGVTNKLLYYLKIPSFLTSHTSSSKFAYNFQVLSEKGDKVEVKSLIISRNLDELFHQFTVGSNGEILLLTLLEKKVQCTLYK